MTMNEFTFQYIQYYNAILNIKFRVLQHNIWRYRLSNIIKMHFYIYLQIYIQAYL